MQDKSQPLKLKGSGLGMTPRSQTKVQWNGSGGFRPQTRQLAGVSLPSSFIRTRVLAFSPCSLPEFTQSRGLASGDLDASADGSAGAGGDAPAAAEPEFAVTVT